MHFGSTYLARCRAVGSLSSAGVWNNIAADEDWVNTYALRLIEERGGRL